MRIMHKVRATDFARNFGRYREQAQREPIAITSHDRVTGYFVSADDYEYWLQFKSRFPRAYHASEIPEWLIKEIEQTEMDPIHDHLNALLDDVEAPAA